MGAIFKGQFRIARRLFSAKCAVNQTNHAGQTPFMYAALFDRKKIAYGLLRKGADPAAVDALGNTATSVAEGQANLEMANLLRRASANGPLK